MQLCRKDLTRQQSSRGIVGLSRKLKCVRGAPICRAAVTGSRELIKVELLKAVEGLGMRAILPGSQEEKVQVDALLRQLESCDADSHLRADPDLDAGPSSPSSSSSRRGMPGGPQSSSLAKSQVDPRLFGTWELIYAGNGTAVTRTGVAQAMITASERLPGVGIKGIRQTLSLDPQGGIQTTNEAEFGVGLLGTWLVGIDGAWNNTGNGRTVKVQFERFKVKPIGLLGIELPDWLPQVLVSVGEGNPARGGADWTTTYVDGELRVGRGKSGNSFLFRKREGSCSVTAAASGLQARALASTAGPIEVCLEVASSFRMKLAAAAGLLLFIAPSAFCYEYAKLEKWFVDNGGQLKTRIGTNSQGYRGLFAKQHIEQGEAILTASGATIINAGAISGAFLTPTLILLRELLHPASRFKPYISSFPSRDQVVNACNLKEKYWGMLQSPHWEKFVKSWQDYMQLALEGRANADMEVTIPEMLGNVTGKLTLDDIKYACALTSTRYVATDKRQRLLMIPIYDMANHKRECPYTLTPYEEGDEISMIAEVDTPEGSEICYSYGTMRDDYAVMHYGFLPDLEDPPRLLQVDHKDFNPDAHVQNISEEQFTGSLEEMRAEQARLKGILQGLEELDKAASSKGKEPAKGSDYVHDLLKELQWRRRNALRYEIDRLQKLTTSQEL